MDGSSCHRRRGVAPAAPRREPVSGGDFDSPRACPPGDVRSRSQLTNTPRAACSPTRRCPRPARGKAPRGRTRGPVRPWRSRQTAMPHGATSAVWDCLPGERERPACGHYRSTSPRRAWRFSSSREALRSSRSPAASMTSTWAGAAPRVRARQALPSTRRVAAAASTFALTATATPARLRVSRRFRYDSSATHSPRSR